MIYLDNSATTRPCERALAAACEMADSEWYNPSALYRQAVAVEKRISAVRSDIARRLGVAPGGVVFTGSGTEADSLAILGTAARFRSPRRILLFAAEHPAVLETAAQLSAMGHMVDYIPATDTGIADLNTLASMLDERVGLLSCMQVGNETGAVQPVEGIGKLLRQANPAALLHVDGVQGFLRLPMDLPRMGIDLYTISAHKVHGLKGVGALAFREGVKLSARIFGGGQEGGLRSGTENTAGIAAFGGAVSWVSSQDGMPERLRGMKLRLYTRLLEGVEGLRVNGPAPEGDWAAPHILNVSLPGVGGEVMLHALEAEGVLVGTGAACSSKKREMSPAFRAMHAPLWAAESAVRFSFGLMNTMAEAEAAAEAAIRCWKRYRAVRR